MRKIATILLLTLLASCLVGCADTLRQRYDTVYIGQPAWSVRDKMGRPTSGDDSSWVWVRDYPFGQATVNFQDGLVTSKSWQDSRPAASAPAAPTQDTSAN